ncbi:MAG: tol-pal system-associated acyl-CoA thioesterase [Zoogloeaceae bacterium]|jgi:acyl-CoA thioester hydrolase|nr:tol-pal system-associated acyl-CoA thioesterase [Zoogloeaceae bacterium]
MTDSIFTLPVRVYYEDTDAAGVVYYASYLKFFERCRTEWFRAAGQDHQGLLDSQGLVFVVKRVQLDYLAPGRLDDLLSIDTSVENLGRAHVVFRQRARREAQILVDGTVQVVCVDIAKMKSAPIPGWLRAKLVAYSEEPAA